MLTKFKMRLVAACALTALSATLSTAVLADQATPGNRVVGGATINITQAPATVALLSRSRVEQDGDFFNAQFCGGTLIAQRWVVTAAHCVVGRDGGVAPASAILALMGTTDLSQPTTQPVNVIQVIVHEEYSNSRTWQRDIALLRLEFDAAETPSVLDNSAQTLNDEVFTAGWGAIREGDDTNPNVFPTQLQGAELRLVPGDQCGTIFPNFAGAVDGTHVCAAVSGALRGSCFGDSGGPLYRITPDGNVGRLVGVVSGGFRCGETGVYTNVATYIDWIASRTDITPPPQIETNPAENDDDEDELLAIAGGAALVGLAAGAVAGSGSWILFPMIGLLLVRRRIARKSDNI